MRSVAWDWRAYADMHKRKEILRNEASPWVQTVNLKEKTGHENQKLRTPELPYQTNTISVYTTTRFNRPTILPLDGLYCSSSCLKNDNSTPFKNVHYKKGRQYLFRITRENDKRTRMKVNIFLASHVTCSRLLVGIYIFKSSLTGRWYDNDLITWRWEF